MLKNFHHTNNESTGLVLPYLPSVCKGFFCPSHHGPIARGLTDTTMKFVPLRAFKKLKEQGRPQQLPRSHEKLHVYAHEV